MESQRNYIFFMLFLAALITAAKFDYAEAAGECGRYTSPDREAFKLIPCMTASQDPYAQVLKTCCIAIEKLAKNPSCLCAVMLSNTAKSAGSKPEVSITIPKRCNLVKRPIGYNCGGYILP